MPSTLLLSAVRLSVLCVAALYFSSPPVDAQDIAAQQGGGVESPLPPAPPSSYFQQPAYHRQINRPMQMPTLTAAQPQQPLQLTVIKSNDNQRNLWDAQNPYIKAMYDSMLELHNSMNTKSIKFDSYFKKLLALSKRDLHTMFVETYGLLYVQNKEIFTDMFGSLEQYYATGRVNLSLALESFFARLYQKMFQALNPSYAFHANYLECATKQVPHLKPFGDVPTKLIKEIKDSFIAARTLLMAIGSGVDFVNNVMSLGPPPECLNLIQSKLISPKLAYSWSMTSIPARNQRQLVPCQQYCELVISRCMGKLNLDVLNDHWNAFVPELTLLAVKVNDNYNIAIAIEPLDVKVSDAIMNLQENGTNISESVFAACGKPTDPVPNSAPRLVRASLPVIGRLSRREVLSNPYSYPNSRSGTVNNSPMSSRQYYPQHDNYGGTFSEPKIPADTKKVTQELPVLIEDIRKFMNSMKSFWNNLPAAVCANKTAQTAQPNSRKQPACFEDKLQASDNNVEIRYRVDIAQQAEKLAKMTSKMKMALSGQEIDLTFDHFSPSTIPPPATMSPDDEEGPEDSTPDEGSGNGPDEDELLEDTSEDEPVEDEETTTMTPLILTPEPPTIIRVPNPVLGSPSGSSGSSVASLLLILFVSLTVIIFLLVLCIVCRKYL